jgi:ribonucleoside-diphosphate reductase alpha chain
MYYLRTQAATQAIQFTIEKKEKPADATIPGNSTDETPEGISCGLEEGCVVCGS